MNHISPFRRQSARRKVLITGCGAHRRYQEHGSNEKIDVSRPPKRRAARPFAPNTPSRLGCSRCACCDWTQTCTCPAAAVSRRTRKTFFGSYTALNNMWDVIIGGAVQRHSPKVPRGTLSDSE